MSQKIALITGGSRGLGRNAALHLAQQGVGIIITYLDRSDAADAVVKEIQSIGAKAVALQLNIGQSDTFLDFAAAMTETLKSVWGRDTFDFLVNNAGTGVFKPFAETSEAEFDLMMNVHLKGVYFLTQQMLSILADGGKILNVSSGLTRFSMPGYAAYATMKGAVEVMTNYLAKELGHRGISVNVIAPGAIETDFGGGAVRDNKELNQLIAQNTAMGRVGLPDDIGSAISSLLNGDNQWMTAQRIEVSGGQNI